MNYSKFLRVLSFLILAVTIGVVSTGCTQKIPYVSAEELPKHIQAMGHEPSKEMILVDSKSQTLTILKDNRIHKQFTIATGKNGLGQRINTFQTPQGLHRVNEKIGHGIPKYGIFYRRQFIGTWRKEPRAQHFKDYVSTRILRLEGLQRGFNRGRDWLGRNVDTEKRAVYIHGTTMEWKLGYPSTKGCVHMSAEDVIKLFNEVPVGTLVWIN